MKEMLELNPKLPGWCEIPKAVTLYNLVLATKPKVVVEVGTFGGRSAFPVAMALRKNGEGVIHCIDPWSPEASKEGQVADIDRKWWGDLNHEIIYQKFVDQIKKSGLEYQFVIHRMKSSEFDGPATIDVFHCDGNHGPDALADTMKFASRVPQGGYVILDDCNWTGGFVTKSAEWLKENGFLELHPLGTGALYYRL